MPDFRLGSIGSAAQGLAYSTLRWQAMSQKAPKDTSSDAPEQVRAKVPVDADLGRKVDIYA